MQAVKAYYDGDVFIPTMPVRAKKNGTVIVTFLDDETTDYENKTVHKYYTNTEWLRDSWKIAGFKPLSREEIYART